jgi:hypothetical protein
MSKHDITSYEWTLESLSEPFTFIDEDGKAIIDRDIIDSDHSPELRGFRKFIGSQEFRVGIVRDTHDKRDHDLIDRLWAYFNNEGKLDTYFRNASGIAVVPVPKRYLSEAA